MGTFFSTAEKALPLTETPETQKYSSVPFPLFNTKNKLSANGRKQQIFTCFNELFKAENIFESGINLNDLGDQQGFSREMHLIFTRTDNFDENPSLIPLQLFVRNDTEKKITKRLCAHTIILIDSLPDIKSEGNADNYEHILAVCPFIEYKHILISFGLGSE